MGLRAPLAVSLSETVITRFPGAMVGAFCVARLQEALTHIDDQALLCDARMKVSGLGLSTETLGEHPLIAGWRQGYKQCGVKPSKYRSSIEALMRRAVRGDDLAIPVRLVNVYNAVSIRNMAPLGGYDAAKLPETPIQLRLADPARDRFAPLGAEPSAFPLSADLVIYGAGDEVLCWGFNGRDSAATCLDDHTDEAVFFTECAIVDHHGPARAVLEDLSALLASAGADCSSIRFWSGNES